jgi:hypothetical protein
MYIILIGNLAHRCHIYLSSHRDSQPFQFSYSTLLLAPSHTISIYIFRNDPPFIRNSAPYFRKFEHNVLVLSFKTLKNYKPPLFLYYSGRGTGTNRRYRMPLHIRIRTSICIWKGIQPSCPCSDPIFETKYLCGLIFILNMSSPLPLPHPTAFSNWGRGSL